MKLPHPFLIKGTATIPVIAHAPHGGTYIASNIRKKIILDDVQLKRELILMTDSYTPELFSSIVDLGGIMMMNNYSRLVIDPERFEDEKKEIMVSRGMGAIYTKTAHQGVLRSPMTLKEKSRLIDKYFRPYHLEMEKTVSNLIEKFEHCLIIDCHSFSSKPFPYEFNQSSDRPDICIGTDSFHTPKRVISTIKTFCKNHNLKVAINEPFGGTFVPLKFYKEDKRVSSVMLEINRSLYMNEKRGTRLRSFTNFQELISRLIMQLTKF